MEPRFLLTSKNVQVQQQDQDSNYITTSSSEWLKKKIQLKALWRGLFKVQIEMA